MGKRILIVEDDPSVRALVSDFLGEHDFEIVAAANGVEMDRALQAQPIDLVILDVRLPGDDGFTLVRTLRERSQLPVIMLTSQNHEVDRILGLELGADDYLTKPFSPRELLARIRAVIRRHEHVPEAGPGAVRGEVRGYQFAGWELRTGSRRLTSPKQESVDLTNSEYSLLVTFLRSPQVILSRERLLEGTRIHADVFDRSIDVQIMRLRRKIEENPNEPKIIRTERSVGYCFDAPVSVIK